MFLAKLNEVYASRKSFISDRLNFVAVGVALVINIIHWLVLYIKVRPGNDNILLHYNVIWGPDLVDKSSYVYLIPLVALIMLVANLIISVVFYHREKLASYFFNYAGIAVQLVFFVPTLLLIKINA